MIKKINNIIINESLFRIVNGYMCTITYHEDPKGSSVVISMSFLGSDAKATFNKIKKLQKVKSEI